jgi:hypothetical protein
VGAGEDAALAPAAALGEGRGEARGELAVGELASFLSESFSWMSRSIISAKRTLVSAGAAWQGGARSERRKVQSAWWAAARRRTLGLPQKTLALRKQLGLLSQLILALAQHRLQPHDLDRRVIRER